MRGDHLCSWNFESTVLYTAQEEGCSKGSHTKLKPHSNPALQHSVPYVEQSKVASPRRSRQAPARCVYVLYNMATADSRREHIAARLYVSYWTHRTSDRTVPQGTRISHQPSFAAHGPGAVVKPRKNCRSSLALHVSTGYRRRSRRPNGRVRSPNGGRRK